MELEALIKAYIRNWGTYIRELEEYKWIAFRHFKEFFYESDAPFWHTHSLLFKND